MECHNTVYMSFVLTRFCGTTNVFLLHHYAIFNNSCVKVKQYIDVPSYAKIVFKLGNPDNKCGI